MTVYPTIDLYKVEVGAVHMWWRVWTQIIEGNSERKPKTHTQREMATLQMSTESYEASS